MRYVLAILLCGSIGVGIYVFQLYKSFTTDNVAKDDEYELFIPRDYSFDQVEELLVRDGVLHDIKSFKQLARIKQYTKDVVPSGRYLITPSMTNLAIINKLRVGHQDPVRLTISQGRFVHDVAGQIAQKMSFDSLGLLNVLVDEDVLSRLRLSKEQAITQIIPNTYEVYWDLTPKELVTRLHREYNRFWDQNDRRQMAESIGMSLADVSTLASIVEKESIQSNERPIIAGLYLNRLKRNIPLQADPTVVFGVGDFSIRRVLLKHLSYDSPYNTYLFGGLPPGPICLPSIATIDAVLNASSHDYLYMCSKPGYNGAHLFAATLSEHERNATIYRRWLNSEGIF